MTCAKKGSIIEGGKVVQYPLDERYVFPLNPPSDVITLWVGKNDFYYEPHGYVADQSGHIHIPVNSEFAKAAGVVDGITLERAKHLLDDYAGETFIKEHSRKFSP